MARGRAHNPMTGIAGKRARPRSDYNRHGGLKMRAKTRILLETMAKDIEHMLVENEKDHEEVSIDILKDHLRSLESAAMDVSMARSQQRHATLFPQHLVPPCGDDGCIGTCGGTCNQ